MDYVCDVIAPCLDMQEGMWGGEQVGEGMWGGENLSQRSSNRRQGGY